MKARIEALYLDYFNDFLTVGAFADWYGMDDGKAAQVLNIGRRLMKRRFP